MQYDAARTLFVAARVVAIGGRVRQARDAPSVSMGIGGEQPSGAGAHLKVSLAALSGDGKCETRLHDGTAQEHRSIDGSERPCLRRQEPTSLN